MKKRCTHLPKRAPGGLSRPMDGIMQLEHNCIHLRYPGSRAETTSLRYMNGVEANAGGDHSPVELLPAECYYE